MADGQRLRSVRPADDETQEDALPKRYPPSIPTGTRRIAAVFGRTPRWLQLRLRRPNPPPVHRDPETGVPIAVQSHLEDWVSELPLACPDDVDEGS
jgi:hypothetical protein